MKINNQVSFTSQFITSAQKGTEEAQKIMTFARVVKARLALEAGIKPIQLDCYTGFVSEKKGYRTLLIDVIDTLDVALQKSAEFFGIKLEAPSKKYNLEEF